MSAKYLQHDYLDAASGKYPAPSDGSPNFKNGDPVMVSMDGSVWFRARFARVEFGKVLTYSNGDGWTSHERTTGWNFVRRPTVEDLK